MYYIIINVGVIEVSAVIKANHGHLANTTTNLDENPNFCENINLDENTQFQMKLLSIKTNTSIKLSIVSGTQKK